MQDKRNVIEFSKLSYTIDNIRTRNLHTLTSGHFKNLTI